MPFDNQTRNRLARFVSDGRNLLTDEFTKQLQEVFGIQPDGIIVPLEKLTHLSDEQMSEASVLRDRVAHLASGLMTEKRPAVAAIDRMTREQSFTVLNRFAALRMCEERGIVQECVRNGLQSKGFQVYLKVAGSGLGDQYERYKEFLFCVFDEIAVDLGILFDRVSPFGLLFPREPALQELLEIINTAELKTIWAEDETIGWVYQYFNSVEERKAMREASQAPRNSRELAVRNQFFTPRYVVEFLSDNTLGRIWYEMRKGNTVLKEECRYLVRRPNEVFLAPGEKAPAEADGEADLSQEELLKRPVYVEYRPLKDPRDIRMLDPACGSMHFGLYAFDLFERIYDEAWELEGSLGADVFSRPEGLKPLRETYGSKEVFLRDMPRLVIEHNLHGIDIDPRAVQIAALALWLRAQKAWKGLGLKAAERPRIKKSNIVTAEPMPGEEGMRREFTESLKPRVLGQLVNVLFEKMKLAGEAGPLLKIEEEIRGGIAEAKRQWVKGPEMEQVALFPHLIKHQLKQERLDFDVKGVTDEAFWDQAEERILTSLRGYAEQIENGRSMSRRLFAEDAALGFAFIDLCRKHYDVVLMNPPFGRATEQVFIYSKKHYPTGYTDIFSCMILAIKERWPNALIGIISTDTLESISRLAEWRCETFLPGLLIYIGLGNGVLDAAMVATAAYCLAPSSAIGEIPFLNIDRSSEKAADILNWVSALLKGQLSSNAYLILRHNFMKIPERRLLYKMPETLWRFFRIEKTIEPAYATVRQGLSTFDDFRFLRLTWEIDAANFGRGKKWVPFSKGGDFETYYADVFMAVNWGNDGEELAEVNLAQNAQTAQSRQGSDYYYSPGVTFTPRSGRGFSARPLAAQCIMSNKGPKVISQSSYNNKYLLGLLNADFVRAMLHLHSNAMFFAAGLIKDFPWITPGEDMRKEVEVNALIAWTAKKSIAEIDETHRCFSISLLLKRDTITLKESCQQLLARRDTNAYTAYEAASKVSAAVAKLYGAEGVSLSEFGVKDDDHETHFDRDLRSEIGIAKALVSATVGIGFGRWDIRECAGVPFLSDPFGDYPKTHGASLLSPDGLPARVSSAGEIACQVWSSEGGPWIASEEWLQARPNYNILPLKGDIKRDSISEYEYPVRVAWDGILVDDPGNKDDILDRVHDVFGVVWRNWADDIYREIAKILDESDYDLRPWFRKNFFEDHIKRYSKSRRKAPIYWALSAASGSYTLWLYYPRLTDQTLFMCVQDFVEPKIKEVERDIERLKKELQNGKKSIRDEVDRLMYFRQELIDFRNELLRVAKLPYKPNLNDGVMVSACPLWKLFRHNAWSRDLKDCWEKMEAGEYDWAHLAYGIWPDRVREVCKRDRSIAIAHGLEDLYQGEMPRNKKAKRKRKGLGIG